jgi:hypothetical protein
VIDDNYFAMREWTNEGMLKWKREGLILSKNPSWWIARRDLRQLARNPRYLFKKLVEALTSSRLPTRTREEALARARVVLSRTSTGQESPSQPRNLIILYKSISSIDRTHHATLNR